MGDYWNSLEKVVNSATENTLYYFDKAQENA